MIQRKELMPIMLILTKQLLEEISGMDFTSIFNSIIYGKEDFGAFIQEALQVFGWQFKELTSKKSTWNFGFKTQLKNGCQHVISVLESALRICQAWLKVMR